MKDIEYSLIEHDIKKLCINVVRYVCKNKISELLSFYIEQYACFYINQNIHILISICNRIKRIDELCEEHIDKTKTYFNIRIIRIIMNELYVILYNMTRRNTKMIYRDFKKDIQYDCNAPYMFILLFESCNIDVNSFIRSIRSTFNIDDSIDLSSVKELVYVCVTKKHDKIVDNLNILSNNKTLTENITISADVLCRLKLKNNSSTKFNIINIFLFYVCITTCNIDRINICEIICGIYFSNLKHSKGSINKRFNLLLYCYNYAFCSACALSKFEWVNKYYKPIVIQSSLKIDYAYKETEIEYPKLNMDLEMSSNNRNNNPYEIYIQYLFTIPSSIKKKETGLMTIHDTSSTKSDDTIKTLNVNDIKPPPKKNIMLKKY
jgi:hypothetical protein